ncbi:MAG: hypothetical protein NTU53_04180 [Planctomycetota bacterium]|nr:hypothetical protein [Planctomycetota bacterium]
MTPNCITTPGVASDVRQALTAGMDRLRARMLRDLELYLTDALARTGQQRLIQVITPQPEHPGSPAGRRCA